MHGGEYVGRKGLRVYFEMGCEGGVESEVMVLNGVIKWSPVEAGEEGLSFGGEGGDGGDLIGSELMAWL